MGRWRWSGQESCRVPNRFHVVPQDGPSLSPSRHDHACTTRGRVTNSTRTWRLEVGRCTRRARSTFWTSSRSARSSGCTTRGRGTSWTRTRRLEARRFTRRVRGMFGISMFRKATRWSMRSLRTRSRIPTSRRLGGPIAAAAKRVPRRWWRGHRGRGVRRRKHQNSGAPG